jgi:hypothetical protein
LLLLLLTVPEPVTVAAQMQDPIRDRAAYVHKLPTPVAVY